MVRFALASAATLVAAGCTDVKSYHSFPGQTLRTEAQSRLVLSRPIVYEADGRRVRPDRIVCAEPSPDAITAQGRAASAQGRLPLTAGTPAAIGTAEAGLAYAVAQQTAYAGYRTATIQAIRDLAFQACLGYANGVIDDTDYRRILAGTDNMVLGMHAIDALAGNAPAPPVTVGAGGQSSAQPGQAVTAGATPASITINHLAAPSPGPTAGGAGVGGGGTSTAATNVQADKRTTGQAGERSQAERVAAADAIVRIICHTVLNREPVGNRVVPTTGGGERMVTVYENLATWGCPRPGDPASTLQPAPATATPPVIRRTRG